MRSTSVKTLVELADEGVDLHFFTADLGFRILEPLRERHPARFTNAGVAEANMVSVAAGMSLLGKRPVCYSMVPFLFMRAFEQVRVDVVAPRRPVVLLGVGGGLSYGSEGMSHHAVEDLAMARALPGLRVIAPGDPWETAAAVRLALTADGPTFIRLGKNGDPAIHSGNVDIKSPIGVWGGGEERRTVIFVTGHILAAAVEAAKILESQGRRVAVVSVPMLKPFDQTAVRELVRGASAVISVEEHSTIGGLGTELAELLLVERFQGKFAKIGLPDAYCASHGTLDWLRQQYGLDPAGIARRVAEVADERS